MVDIVFEAKNPKQLDICLKMLYAEKVNFTVKVLETINGKIYYQIVASVSDEDAGVLKERYRILIS